MKRLFLLILIGVNGPTLLAQTTNATGAGTGADAHWLTAAKNGFGTSNSLSSKVWFTLTSGVLSEVYYPTLDVPNVEMLQFIIVTPNGAVETEIEHTRHSITVLDQARSLSFLQENQALSGEYKISKSYVTDPKRNSLLVRVSFSAREDVSRYRVFVYFDPSLNNSGFHDSGWSEGQALLSQDLGKSCALVAMPAFVETANGFLGVDDGLTQLRARKPFSKRARADNGNVVQTARINTDRRRGSHSLNFTIALGFGEQPAMALASANQSLKEGFSSLVRQYQTGWRRYTGTLPQVESRFQSQLRMAAMVLKGLEDKTYRGAMIASPSIPWGGGSNANESSNSGYHAVWSRDLYHVATAFMALNDKATAVRALNYLFHVQQKPDGSFPQNSWLDGRPIGQAVQMDEVAFPIILAYELKWRDRETWTNHIKPAADYLMKNGPATEQERWEEESGYSPSTIAAEIAALVCAAEIARSHGETASANSYLQKADEWAQNVDRWTATTNGKLDPQPYYLRITSNDNPNDGEPLEINSSGGTYDEREIVDAGFLELVRLGIKRPDDPLIRRSLAIVDRLIKVDTPAGSGWYRYNHDAYGERDDGGIYDGRNGRGRLWALLSGERGEYELALGNKGLARTRLDTMRSFANDGMMIPEQVWDKPDSSNPALRVGKGTGSATPLAWSMAQYIRLAVKLKSGLPLGAPQVVAARYSRKREKNNERLKFLPSN